MCSEPKMCVFVSFRCVIVCICARNGLYVLCVEEMAYVCENEEMMLFRVILCIGARKWPIIVCNRVKSRANSTVCKQNNAVTKPIGG